MKSFEQLIDRVDMKVKKYAEDVEFVNSVTKVLERVVDSFDGDPDFTDVAGIATVSATKNIENVYSVYFQLVLDPERYRYLMDVSGVQDLTGKLAPKCQAALGASFPGMEFKVKVGVVPVMG